jgi:hypothetical protein
MKCSTESMIMATANVFWLMFELMGMLCCAAEARVLPCKVLAAREQTPSASQEFVIWSGHGLFMQRLTSVMLARYLE